MSLYQHGLTLKALLENPDLLTPPRTADDEKTKEEILEGFGNDLFNAQSAFLGPTLWDKTLAYDDTDFRLEFMDLDEFINETVLPDVETRAQNGNGVQQQEGGTAKVAQNQVVQTPPQLKPSIDPQPVNSDHTPSVSPKTDLTEVVEQKGPVVNDKCPAMLESPVKAVEQKSQESSPSPENPAWKEVKVDFQVDPNDLVLATMPGHEDFDPCRRHFTEEELRPQPLIKKSRKVFVAEDAKDDKYWARRRKNNVAARRSRDARRAKENQIAMRALFLEKENTQLKVELETARKESYELRKRLAKYESPNL